jgi:hypothetical protein
MTLANGSQITRDDLMHNQNYEYNGNITRFRLKPKGNGKQDLTINTDTYSLSNKLVYTFSSDTPFPAHLYNGSKGNGNSMGKWYIDLNNVNITISYCDQSDFGSDVQTTAEAGNLFEIESGAVNLLQNASTEFTVLGANWRDASHYITAEFKIDGKSYEPFGDASDPVNANLNYNGSSSYNAGVIQSGGALSVIGRSFTPPPKTRRGKKSSPQLCMEAASAPSNQQVILLTDGNPVPNIKGSSGQADVATFLTDYIDPVTGVIRLADNQVIFLFELGNTNVTSSGADFQDLVVLVTMTPQE